MNCGKSRTTCTLYVLHPSSYINFKIYQAAGHSSYVYCLCQETNYFTCSNCIASLIHCHLTGHMHNDLGLWTLLYVCSRDHSCRYCIRRHCHTISLKFLHCSSSSGSIDHGHYSPCLASSRYRYFCLGNTCHWPIKNNVNIIHLLLNRSSSPIIYKFSKHFISEMY